MMKVQLPCFVHYDVIFDRAMTSHVCQSSTGNSSQSSNLKEQFPKYSVLHQYQMGNQHYNDVITGAMASQITSLTIVYSTVYSGTDNRKHQSYASLDFVRGIHRWPVNSPDKRPVTRKMFSFDAVIMNTYFAHSVVHVLLESDPHESYTNRIGLQLFDRDALHLYLYCKWLWHSVYAHWHHMIYRSITDGMHAASGLALVTHRRAQ